ncbi:nuclear transport factor 2 family protein [Mucilaginibacter flavus]|uniref:nuclear transport factor 2 family protein n=1 Tax=Mucilaginibacter flavus TaxID=931504 RepID=UPI0025B4E9B0|nr:nuclear transport factor 2 family protein [Mucilaginibacter flavus]
MRKGTLTVICMGLLLMFITGQKAVAAGLSVEDTVKKVKPEVLQTINTVLKASYTFDIDKVTDMYAPNAVVTDEQEPYSWNGQLAGVQWVNSVQKAVKDFKIRDFFVSVKKIKIFQQTEEVAYLVVPVEYTGTINGDPFNEEGAFSFVFRYVSGKWLIKSQAWVPKNAL